MKPESFLRQCCFLVVFVVCIVFVVVDIQDKIVGDGAIDHQFLSVIVFPRLSSYHLLSECK